MAPPPIHKQEFLGAVTLVSFSVDGSLLYVGVGPSVFLYATASGELLGVHNVVTRGILHGCDVVGLSGSNGLATTEYAGAFFGQKRVACFQNLPQTPEQARESKDLRVLGHPKVFCDWVFDVQLLSEEAEAATGADLLAAVGLAHNLVQIWNPTSNEVIRSVQCAERCILYALAFYGRSQDTLIVASGTVFQQILLWDPMEDGEDVVPTQRLHAHDGVLFKLAWSSDARSLASVSDDRTVQLWSNHTSLTTDELHLLRSSSRAELLSADYTPVFRAWGHSARIWDVCFWENGVATASEDGLCKLWDLDGNCVATLQGHMGRHIWRAAVHTTLKLVATGGGDGATKLWDIPRQLMSSSGKTDSCESITVPIATTASALTRKKMSSHSVRDIVLHPLDNAVAFVASEHGSIFRLHLTSLEAESFFSAPTANATTTGQGRSGGLSTFTIDYRGRFLLLGDITGCVSVVDVDTGLLLHCWTAQANVRIMKIWWNQEDALFASSANGVLTEWKPTSIIPKEELTPSAITMKLVATFKIPAKSSASSVLVVDRRSTRNVCGGDGHGNMYIFQRSLAVPNDSDLSSSLPPAVVLKGVHGRELVATLLLSSQAFDGGINQLTLLSGGHDGYICSFILNEDTKGALTASLVGRESIRGISTIKQLWWNNGDLMAFGFHAAQAILHNFSAQYRIFNVECGGWRRPHALHAAASDQDSALPSHTFVFTPPAALKQQIEVKVHSTLLKRPGSVDTTPRFSTCSLHDHHHGCMTTCVAFLGSDRLVTAAEDNSLMLHRRGHRDVHGKKHWRWIRVASGIAHTTTVRALATFSISSDTNGEDHIILSGGGKQRLNVWLVRGESDLLRHVCGQERADAAQDHRILGLATFSIPKVSDAYRLVTACNSEGSTQLLLLDLNRGRLFELGDCRSASRKPILSCAGFQESEGNIAAGLAVGSTDGLVTLWNLSVLLKELAEVIVSGDDESLFNGKLQEIIRDMQPCGNYLAHDMGTNCITLVSCTKSPDQQGLNVAFVSGGDDQNLFMCELQFPSCEVLREARTINASGSAIKTVACVDSKTVYAGGYDQRVSQWRINRDSTQVEWQGAAFSECADIADLTVREVPTQAADDVVVVGQGLQMFQFRRD